jgi:hypothetical protein
MKTSPEVEPTTPSKMNFVGFDGSSSKESPITGGPVTPPASVSSDDQNTRKSLTMGDTQNSGDAAMPLMVDSAGIRGAKSIKTPGACPYVLPEGVKLLRYERKSPPVAVTVCSVVNDPPKFIRHALQELDARLHHPVQIKAGDSVFELLSKLADCGVELHLEWPPERITENSPDSEPSKPTKLAGRAELNPHLEITDEDVPL